MNNEQAKQQAMAQMASIRGLVQALWDANWADDDTKRDEADEAIRRGALSVEVRSAWMPVGESLEAAEYRIVLCTGGPHVEIRGDLTAYAEPENVSLYCQDWGTQLERVPLSFSDEDMLLEYARIFYFG